MLCILYILVDYFILKPTIISNKDIQEPPPGDTVAINPLDYFIIRGLDAHFDWLKEGSPYLPPDVYINPTGKRLLIEHYSPADDAGVYVCDVYNRMDYFIAGRRFILGKGNDK